MITTSNCLLRTATYIIIHGQPFTSAAQLLWGKPSHKYLNAITIETTQAIADTGATLTFIMDGIDVVNKRPTNKPLFIKMPDERQMESTHICDITLPRLPTILMGHIVPHLAVALLIGIRPSCKLRCTVAFNKDKWNVIFKGVVILQGYKDVSTNLWTLPINSCSNMRTTLSQSAPGIDCAPHDICPTIHPGIDLASFTHSAHTCANGVKFAHQSLCNPKISTLLKTVRKGFLKSCPNLTKKLILKYLNLSPATTKGHMKWSRHGIKSTQPKQALPRKMQPVPQIAIGPPPDMDDTPIPNVF
jgi:hypothetical protein